MSGLLEKLGLRRRAAPVQAPVAPVAPVLPSTQAQPFMYRAAAASRTAREAGLDLNGQRDTMRTAIDTQAQAGNLAQAGIMAAAFETLVNDALAWQARGPERGTALAEAQRLSALGDGPSGALLNDVQQAETYGAANNFQAANRTLDTTIAALARRGQAQPLIAQAEAHAARARAVGVDLAAGRENLRQEIADLADADDIAQAGQKLAAFGTLIDEALVWHGRAQELAAARSAAQQLKTDGDTAADALIGELAQSEAEAAADRYPAAGTALDTARPRVEARALAWPLIKRADAASARATQAGLDPGGRREALRKEIVDLAEAGDLAGAGNKATAFEGLVNAGVSWQAREGEVGTLRGEAQKLKSEGDAQADPLLLDLTTIEQEAAAGHFIETLELLDAATEKIRTRVQGWALVGRAGAAAKKAADAGLELGGQRETLRLEIVGLADGGQIAQAETKATAFEKLVDGAIAWPGRGEDIKKARADATFLKTRGDPTADTLLDGLKAAEDRATAGAYSEAIALLDPAIAAVTDRLPIWKKLREHQVEMLKIKPRVDLAIGVGGIPGRNLATSPLAAQWTAFDQALLACPTTGEPDPTKIAELAGKRATLTAALNALVKAYAAGPVTAVQSAWAEKEFAERQKQMAPLLQKVKYVVPKTQQQETLLQAFNAVNVSGANYDEIFVKMDEQVAKAEALLAAVKTPTVIDKEKEYFKAYGKVRDRIEAARANTDTTEPTKTEKANFTLLWTPFNTKLTSTAADRFSDCLAKLPALTQAADKVLAKQVAAALKAVDDIGAPTPASGPTGAPVPATNAQRSQRALSASQIDPVILRQLPVDKKLALLEGLRANGGPPAFVKNPSNKDDPLRKAQRDIYAIMDLDEAFVNAEKTTRKAVVAELMASNKAELQRARDEWPSMSDGERIAVMEKVMAAHCDKMGFKAPTNPGGGGKPIVARDTGDPNNNGGYTPPPDDVIEINTTGMLYADFELMMDLIIHENSHNWQGQLVDRLTSTGADKLTKDNTDPPYTQALMFQANNNDNEIVDPEEDYDGYQKQPWEDHSWQTGPKTARMLMKELAK